MSLFDTLWQSRPPLITRLNKISDHDCSNLQIAFLLRLNSDNTDMHSKNKLQQIVFLPQMKLICVSFDLFAKICMQIQLIGKGNMSSQHRKEKYQTGKESEWHLCIYSENLQSK